MGPKRDERKTTGTNASREGLGRRREENRKRRRESRERHGRRRVPERCARERNSGLSPHGGKRYRCWGSFSREKHQCKSMEHESIPSSLSRSSTSSCSRSTSRSVSRSTSSEKATSSDVEREVLEALKQGQRDNPLVPGKPAEVSREETSEDSDSGDEKRAKARARQQETRVRDKITCYRQRLRQWEKRERARAKKYAAELRKQCELEEEHAKDVDQVQKFMTLYDDDKDDVVYFSGRALHSLRRFREREMRMDRLKRQRERYDLKEIRQRLVREGVENPGAEALRLYFGRGAAGGLRKQKPRNHAVTHPNFQPEPPSQQASSGNTHSGSATTSGSRKPQASHPAVTHPNFGPAHTSQQVSSGNRHSGGATTSGSRKPQPPDPAVTHPNFGPDPTSQQASIRSSHSSGATTGGLRKHRFLYPALTHPHFRRGTHF